jgi:hypothetical protein
LSASVLTWNRQRFQLSNRRDTLSKIWVRSRGRG